MHHHLCALLKQSDGLFKKDIGPADEGNESTKENPDVENKKNENSSSQEKEKCSPLPDKRFVRQTFLFNVFIHSVPFISYINVQFWNFLLIVELY